MATTLAVLRHHPRAIAAGIAVAATLLAPSIAPDPASAATTKTTYGWPVKPFHRSTPSAGSSATRASG